MKVYEDNQVKLYEDDLKILVVIKALEDATYLQKDLSSICDWSNDWLKQFNESKCEVIHLGRSDPKFNYCMKDQENLTKYLEKTKQEKEKGVALKPD